MTSSAGPSRRSRLKLGLMVALVLLAVALALWRVSKARCLQLVGEVTCRVETTERIVALSIDDGPTPEGVNAVLPVLERFGVKATFFLIGKQMARSPGQAERLLAAGHELGNHTWSHERNIGHLPPTTAARLPAPMPCCGRLAPNLRCSVRRSASGLWDCRWRSIRRAIAW